MSARCTVVVLVVGALGAGCAALPAYEVEMEAARAALDRDDAEAARVALEARLARDGLGGAEAALLRLELATVALGLDDHHAAAAALAEADPLLEVVDLSRDDEGELASWLYADAARPYRAPTWEKLMVNVLGMASRMAAGDLRGALVEARRFEVMARFFTGAGEDPGLVGPFGHLLAAAVHRATGRPAAAERHLASAGIHAVAGPLAPGEGEVLVIVLDGRSPHKVAETVSLSEAERVAAQPGAAERLQALGAKDVTLVRLTAPRAAAEPPVVVVAGAAAEVAWGDLEATARARFERSRPRLARAALSRALSRQSVERSLASVDRTANTRARTGLGAVLGGVLSRSMRASDVADTRSWSTLPARVGAARMRAPVGEAEVVVGDGAGARRVAVKVRAGRTAVVVVSWRGGEDQGARGRISSR